VKYRFLRGLMRLMVHTVLVGIFTLVGRREVPRTGPLLVCGNHVSTLDPPLVPAFLPRNDSWSMAKAEYFEGTGFKPWMFRSFHSFPVVRHSADRAAIRRATTILKEGQVLILYPEGTRIITGGMHRPQPGAGFIAMVSGLKTVCKSGTAPPSRSFTRSAASMTSRCIPRSTGIGAIVRQSSSAVTG
jgi:1-acyl-sn-glycerol-3-phosphate acyltransferase